MKTQNNSKPSLVLINIKQLNTLSSLFHQSLQAQGVEIKKTRSDEVLSTVLGYKSRNSIINGEFKKGVPLRIVFPNLYVQNLNEELKKFQASNIDCNFVIYDTFDKYDENYAPNDKEEKWLLTPEGWMPSRDFFISYMRFDRDVFSIFQTTSIGFHRGIWSAYDAEFISAEDAFNGKRAPFGGNKAVESSIELEYQTSKLYKKFGRYPDTDQWWHKYGKAFLA